MKKLSYFIATALIGSSLSAAHAEPKMSGTIYIMTEVEHNNKTGVTNTTIPIKVPVFISPMKYDSTTTYG